MNRNEAGCGYTCAALVLIFLLWPVTWLVHPILGSAFSILLLALWLIGRVKKCAICEVPIKRFSYTWKVRGKKRQVCPNCDAALAREESKRAIKRLKDR